MAVKTNKPRATNRSHPHETSLKNSTVYILYSCMCTYVPKPRRAVSPHHGFGDFGDILMFGGAHFREEYTGSSSGLSRCTHGMTRVIVENHVKPCEISPRYAVSASAGRREEKRRRADPAARPGTQILRCSKSLIIMSFTVNSNLSPDWAG